MRRILPLAVGCLLVAISCKKTDFSPASPSEENIETSAAEKVNSSLNVSNDLQRCAANEVLQRQIATDPERGRRLLALERIIQERTATMKGKPGSGGGGGGTVTPIGPITIPVVVHVVLPNPGIVTDNQISSQLAVLNADFKAANEELKKTGIYLAGNSTSIVADCQITFDQPTIIRQTTSVSSFGSNDAVKFTAQGGSDALNPTSMLNIWVCDLSSGLLGYAQFPGGSASTDGVVVDYQAFGTSAGYSLYSQFNKGRTATHEVGHWLNLRHIWGDSRCGDDYVGDTPQHTGANYGCPSESDRSSCKGKTTSDMWMNYMDYTDDRCMYMFTVKQKERIDLTLANARKGYY